MIRKLFFAAVLLAASVATSSADDILMRAGLYDQSRKLFLSEHYDRLEALAERYRSRQERTPSGLWKLDTFYAGISSTSPNAAPGDEAWARALVRLDGWLARYPQSPTALTAKAGFLLDLAWAERGNGTAKLTTEEQFEAFIKSLKVLMTFLDEHEDTGGQDPQWGLIRLVAMRGYSADEETYWQWLDHQLTRFPTYYNTYFEAARSYSPMWGGSTAHLAALANHIVDYGTKEDGLAAYARFYWSAQAISHTDDLFEQDEFDPEKLRQGMLDVLTQYPDEWNVQGFAQLSCRAGDALTAAEMFARSKQGPIIQMWGTLHKYNDCYSMAMNQGGKQQLTEGERP